MFSWLWFNDCIRFSWWLDELEYVEEVTKSSILEASKEIHTNLDEKGVWKGSFTLVIIQACSREGGSTWIVTICYQDFSFRFLESQVSLEYRSDSPLGKVLAWSFELLEEAPINEWHLGKSWLDDNLDLHLPWHHLQFSGVFFLEEKMYDACDFHVGFILWWILLLFQSN